MSIGCVLISIVCWRERERGRGIDRRRTKTVDVCFVSKWITEVMKYLALSLSFGFLYLVTIQTC